MITPAYVQTMARYNAWQNKQLSGLLVVMDQDALDLDRGAFFGSIQSTLNHVLWADQLWMQRIGSRAAGPDGPGETHLTCWRTLAEWAKERAAVDRQFQLWADGLGTDDLDRTLDWHSTAENRDLSQSLALCLTHVLNHQTHHRGQVHAMLTAAGHPAPVSDLVFMPEVA